MPSILRERRTTVGQVSLGAAWSALVAALLVEGELNDLVALAVAAGIGAALVLAGFAAASRCRRLSRGVAMRPARLSLLSLVVVVGLGLANLTANWCRRAFSEASVWFVRVAGSR